MQKNFHQKLEPGKSWERGYICKNWYPHLYRVWRHQVKLNTSVLGRCTQPLSDCSRPKVNILLPPLPNRYAKSERTVMCTYIYVGELFSLIVRSYTCIPVLNEYLEDSKWSLYLPFLSRYGSLPWFQWHGCWIMMMTSVHVGSVWHGTMCSKLAVVELDVITPQTPALDFS